MKLKIRYEKNKREYERLKKIREEREAREAKEEAERLRQAQESDELTDQQKAELIELERQRRADQAQRDKEEREAARQAAKYNVKLPEDRDYKEYLFTYNYSYLDIEKYEYTGKRLDNIGNIGSGQNSTLLKIKFSKNINTVHTDRQPRRGIIIEIAKNWHLTVLYKDAVGNYLYKPHLTNDSDPGNHKHYFFKESFNNNGEFLTRDVPEEVENIRIFSLILVSKLAQNLKSDVDWINNMLNQLITI